MGRSRSQKGKGACGKDTEFASSRKARQFIGTKMGRQTGVEAVGGINDVLGSRLKKAGVGSAKLLSAKMQEMSKREYLRYIMKESGSNVRLAMESYVSMKKHCDKQEKDSSKPGKGRRR